MRTKQRKKFRSIGMGFCCLLREEKEEEEEKKKEKEEREGGQRERERERKQPQEEGTHLGRSTTHHHTTSHCHTAYYLEGC